MKRTPPGARHLRNALGLSVTAVAIAGFGVVLAREVTGKIAARLWPTDDSTFVVDGWDVGAA